MVFCLTSLFHSIFFSLSLSLYISLSFSLVLFFLPCFFFSFLLSLCLCFMKEPHQNIKLQNCVHQSFLFLCFLSSFVFQIPFLYLCCFFPDFKLCFCSNINVFHSKRQVKRKKKRRFLVKRGLQQNICVFTTCVLQNVTSYLFWGGPILAKFGLMFKSTVKIAISTYFKNKKANKSILRGYYLVQVWCFLKMTDLDQIITPEILARNLFLSKKCVETPIFMASLTNSVF